MKRTIDLVDDICAEMRPAKRLSMLHNTPKQWKEQRRNILKMSKNKLKELGDIESNLRKSVLINNTYRKMRRELKEQCPYSTNVNFAAYSGSELPNASRIPALKSHNGYTSMARENYDETYTSYDVTSSTEATRSPLCQYETDDDESSKPTAVDSQHEVMSVNSDPDESVQVDNECTDVKSTENIDPESTQCPSSLELDDEPKECSTDKLVHTGQGCAMDIDVNEEPIDYTMKAKDLTITTQCNSELSEQSPPRSSSVLDHSHASPRSGQDGMDLQITASPSQQGLSYDTRFGQQEKVDPELNSNEQEMAHSNAATSQDQSTKESQDTQDFSLCKYASKPYGFLPNILGSDVIPFSTSSLVSIIASREYHSSQCPTKSYTSSLQRNQSKDSSMSSSELQSADSTNIDCSDNNNSHLFSEGDSQTIDKNSRLDTCLSDTVSSDTLYSNINCDSDVNQHIWACFQHFNMAVACS